MVKPPSLLAAMVRGSREAEAGRNATPFGTKWPDTPPVCTICTILKPGPARPEPDAQWSGFLGVLGDKLYFVAVGAGEVGGVVVGAAGLLSRQQRTKSWTTGLVPLAGGQATPTWLGLTPVTGR